MPLEAGTAAQCRRASVTQNHGSLTSRVHTRKGEKMEPPAMEAVNETPLLAHGIALHGMEAEAVHASAHSLVLWVATQAAAIA